MRGLRVLAYESPFSPHGFLSKRETSCGVERGFDTGCERKAGSEDGGSSSRNLNFEQPDFEPPACESFIQILLGRVAFFPPVPARGPRIAQDRVTAHARFFFVPQRGPGTAQGSRTGIISVSFVGTWAHCSGCFTDLCPGLVTRAELCRIIVASARFFRERQLRDQIRSAPRGYKTARKIKRAAARRAPPNAESTKATGGKSSGAAAFISVHVLHQVHQADDLSVASGSSAASRPPGGTEARGRASQRPPPRSSRANRQTRPRRQPE